jgi:hypothetical protein
MGYLAGEALPSPWMTWELFATDLESCTTGFQSWEGSSARARWVVRFRLVERTARGATIDVELSRRLLDYHEAQPELQRRHRLTIDAGEPVTLDALFLDRTEKEACGALFVEGEVVRRDPPELANAQLQYDIWLLSSDAGGRQVRRASMMGRQRAKLDYAFAPLQLEGRPAGNDDAALRAWVGGSVRGSMRRDGRVDLHVITTHSVSNSKSGSSSVGEKDLIVGVGETIELELPEVSGNLDDAGDLKSRFASTRTALRVTVRRIS